ISANLALARKAFREHGGMLRTTNALRLGIHPRSLYALHSEPSGSQDSVSARDTCHPGRQSRKPPRRFPSSRPPSAPRLPRQDFLPGGAASWFRESVQSTVFEPAARQAQSAPSLLFSVPRFF